MAVAVMGGYLRFSAAAVEICYGGGSGDVSSGSGGDWWRMEVTVVILCIDDVQR